jgi:hypothetical protein
MDLEYQIARLQLRPGDVLVLKIAQYLPMEAMKRIKDDLDRLVPGIPAMVLDPNVDLSVLTREEIEQRSAPPSLPAKEL